MKLSIIIPAYNVEKYITKCVSSCMNQNINKGEYEIIIINDGSTDKSGKILKNLKKQYSQIKIIDQSNKGLSNTRNKGLKESSGKYIWFIDSDDWIEKNCLQNILLELNDIDILMLNYQQILYGDSILKIKKQIIYEGFEISGKEIYEKKIPFHIPVQFCIFKKEFLIKNNLNFYPNIYHEDLEFKPRAIYFAKKIKYYTPIVYNKLNERSGSITNQFRLKNGLDYIKVAKSLNEFINKFVKEKSVRKYISYFVGTALNSIFIGLQQLNNKEKKEILDSLNLNKNLYNHFWRSKYPNYMIEYLFLILNTNLGIKFYNKSKGF